MKEIIISVGLSGLTEEVCIFHRAGTANKIKNQLAKQRGTSLSRPPP
jgi:hypothetical protein